MFEKRSKILFVTCVAGTLYSLYLIIYFGMALSDIAGALATMLVTPHIVGMVLGTVFSWIGFWGKDASFVLISVIFYIASAVIFLAYIIFCVPMIVLGLIGYHKQKKINT
ncbi:MAG: hypothetical protein IKU67_05620 [Firmicutes bacterium]|nr:hypothetical protein [Bacillota bacterium]